LIKKIAKILLAVILVTCLVLPGKPVPVYAGQNLSFKEISQIFDKVALEKEVPAEILKAIAYTESGWQQWRSDGSVKIGGSGNYIGIMQVRTPSDAEVASRIKNDVAYNIAYGADILISKWDMTPRIGDGDRSKLENWYFAIWAYNSWSTSNNPSSAAASGRETYQDKVLKLIGTDYCYGLTKPVSVTPVPKSLIPAGVLPSGNVDWKTPEPVHYATATGLSKDQEAAFLSSVTRISGTDRIDTAIKIAYDGWPNGCNTVVITRSEEFSDALAGVALAQKNNAPVLLNPKDELDSRVQEALLRLKPLKVIILGGNNAISDQVEEKIKQVITWTQDFTRIAGQDRYETSALIASSFPLENGVAITAGDNFPDGLSLASAAAAKGCPLLLVAKNSFPQATEGVIRQLCPNYLYVGGGEDAISQELVDKIIEVSGLPHEQVKRFEGKNRYETSAKILTQFFPKIEKMLIATGEDFPDALAGAVLAACQKSPMLLVPPQGPLTGSDTETYLQTVASTNDSEIKVEVFGGKEAITDRSIIKIKDLLEK